MTIVSAVSRTVGLGAVLATLLMGCGGNGGPTQPTPAVDTSRLRAHLDGMLDIMQANSINRLTIEWPALRATVNAQAAPATSIDQLSPAITTALRLLGDGHSSYRSATGAMLFVPTRSCQPTSIGSVDVPANVGYVRVRSFSGTAPAATAYADELQRGIESADRDGLTGWIVDVRGNGGGNMWPMVAGVGPVLARAWPATSSTPPVWKVSGSIATALRGLAAPRAGRDLALPTSPRTPPRGGPHRQRHRQFWRGDGDRLQAAA